MMLVRKKSSRGGHYARHRPTGQGGRNYILIVATQKPVVERNYWIEQGNIPANELALQTASTSDSVRILGHGAGLLGVAMHGSIADECKRYALHAPTIRIGC